MELNADFSRRAVVHAARLAWVPSPMAGVDRRMLDRIGDEVARAGAEAVLADNDGHPGHIFNLGHGVHPDSDPGVLRAVVDLVHERTEDG